MVRDLIIFGRLRCLVIALVPLLWLNFAQADVLDIPSTPKPRADLPTTGMSMQDVLQGWGQPMNQHDTVSQYGPEQHPPINRWDYARFSVVFERDKVIFSVSPEFPPTVKKPVAE